MALNSCSQGKPDPALFESALKLNAYVANQEIREQLFQCAGSVILARQAPAQLKQSFYGLMEQEIQAQIASTPKDARAYVLAGTVLNGIGQYDGARPLFEKAHELSPEKQIIDFELATDYLNTDKNDEAIALLKRAYESAPEFDQAKSAYAIGLIVAGKDAEAHKIFGDDPSIFQTSQVARIYMSLKKYDAGIAILKKIVAGDVTNSDNAIQLAQAQYAAGQIQAAISTLRDIVEKYHPEMKEQAEAAIKQIQK